MHGSAPLQRIDLEGGCYVVGADDLAWTEHDGWRETAVINGANGATAMSQHLHRVAPGRRTPILAWPGSDVVLFVNRGSGELSIAGRKFPIEEGHGAFVKNGEAYRVRSHRDQRLQLTVTVCPECPSPRRLARFPDDFDSAHPVRTVSPGESPRQTMGERYFQVLVGKEVGSTAITQFVGAIPFSRAPAHYHHYEEAITILSGRGRMWTGDRSIPVGPGSVIFLPIRQEHSLECADPGGLKLVGHFYPSGSPAENYTA